jgi:hypothetical protein
LANKDDVESAGILKYDKEKEALAKGKKQAEEGKNEFENFFFKAVSVGK